MAMVWVRAACTILVVAASVSATTKASAQDAARPVRSNATATIHQFGIMRDSYRDLDEAELLDLPNFVHKAEVATPGGRTWLAFSALYIIPPQMTTAPLTLQVQQKISVGSGFITDWYPYATGTARERNWTQLLIGVQAEGLETTHSEWMAARAMDAAATVKVYTPGPTGSEPDDVGTTEGDVFIFARGQAPASAPVDVVFDAASGEWVGNACTIWSDVQFPLGSGNAAAWLAENRGDTIISRNINLDVKSTKCEVLRTSATVAIGRYRKDSAALRMELNEALVGLGLRPDEASAQAELTMGSVSKMEHPALIYTLSPQWINARFPLQIKGPAEDPVRVFVVIRELPRE